MVMPQRRDSEGAHRHWWEDLPPAIRHRLRQAISEELAYTRGQDLVSSPQTKGTQRYDIAIDLFRLMLSIAAVSVIIMLLMLACIIFLYNGENLNIWRF